ncbi:MULTISPECIES: hypothetical protein [Citrobacter]|uniref:hypothetical protein n=1 Tax=Citrobacter TaxID=544 RepID=UPI00064B1444|nr:MULTISPECIES: hypothetical protein [Citrobacter]HBC8789790.1 hypothetical protein [Citrobacter braakii]AKL54611.1 hypothetical protein AB183_01100 [Citrobacter freundii]KSY29532.1 hypothetical protein APU02_10840 [Citrobacter sp. 50677481]HCD1169546.1 hypothetical protein [Citrobacter freundii]HCD1198387.1 hypothetical protein [Citrobacter freundii]
MNLIKKTLIASISIGMVGCAGMRMPDYAEVKTSPYYSECREFAADVYKNDGYSKLANTVILTMNDRKAQAIVSGCVVTMGKNSIEEAKSDLNKKAAGYGILSGACYDASCRVDTEQQLKAYTLGSYYAAYKKFPDQMKPEF